jgi:hypothetical protein
MEKDERGDCVDPENCAVSMAVGARQTNGGELQNRRLQVRFLSHLPEETEKNKDFEPHFSKPLLRVAARWQQKRWQQKRQQTALIHADPLGMVDVMRADSQPLGVLTG